MTIVLSLSLLKYHKYGAKKRTVWPETGFFPYAYRDFIPGLKANIIELGKGLKSGDWSKGYYNNR
ncbi:MAG: hypothetical protein V4450_04885 [Bacteroidota bacterium]